MTLQFLNPSFVTKEVNGDTIRFYAIPTSVLFRLHGLAAPIVNALTTLFKDGTSDVGRTIQEYEGDSDSGAGSRTEILPVSLEHAKYRDTAAREAVEALIGALTKDTTKLLIGDMVMSSMRDHFKRPKGGFPDPYILEFIDNSDLDVITLSHLLMGVLDASKGMLGPLGETAATMIRVLKLRLSSAAAALTVAEAQAEADPTTSG